MRVILTTQSVFLLLNDSLEKIFNHISKNGALLVIINLFNLFNLIIHFFHYQFFIKNLVIFSYFR